MNTEVKGAVKERAREKVEERQKNIFKSGGDRVGEVFYQLVITAGMSYTFKIILEVVQSKILAKLVVYGGVISCASLIIQWVLLVFQALNDKCNNWFKIF